MEKMTKNKPVYTVHVVWDEDAKVFVATSDDIPGLVTEAKTMQKVVDKVVAIAPELLELNADAHKDSKQFAPEWLSFNPEPFFVPFGATHCG